MESFNLKTGINPQNLEIKKGQKIKICLEENPTTGYKWEIDQPLNEILNISNEEFNIHSEAIGGGGKHIFVFEALHLGTATITFNLKQRWSNDIDQSIIAKIKISDK